jgi:two-component system, chemotaxis family, protein-glutamate methylesterase/glutaminase
VIDSPEAVGYDLVVVGTSWGGLDALRTLVTGLPASFSMAVALVQHRHKNSDQLLNTLLQERSSLPVCEVEDKMPLEKGRIYVAPPDYHTLVEPGHFSLSTEGPVRFSRPSIDVTFHSAADSYGHRTVGVVLTGANVDGTEGLRRISERGGLVVIQDPSTAESSVMPSSAAANISRAKVMPMTEIPAFLATLPAGDPARDSA